jgi:hypothetical protein
MRSRELLACVLVFAACRARAPEPPTLVKLPRLADPPAVAAAVEFRQTEPLHALAMLQQTWADAVKANDATLAAFALDRAGDVVMDLGSRWDRQVPLLDESARSQLSACDVADAYYLRAWQWVEHSDDLRLLGRLAHDLAWARERCDHELSALTWYRVALDKRLAAHDALGVRFTANNLGRLFRGPKRERLELYLLAADAARIAEDFSGARKVQTNIARLWFFSADTKWLEPSDAGAEEYVQGPPRGEARKRFLHHLGAALEAGHRAGESSTVVCEGFGVPDFDCNNWLDGKPEEIFPEPAGRGPG